MNLPIAFGAWEGSALLRTASPGHFCSNKRSNAARVLVLGYPDPPVAWGSRTGCSHADALSIPDPAPLWMAARSVNGSRVRPLSDRAGSDTRPPAPASVCSVLVPSTVDSCLDPSSRVRPIPTPIHRRLHLR